VKHGVGLHLILICHLYTNIYSSQDDSVMLFRWSTVLLFSIGFIDGAQLTAENVIDCAHALSCFPLSLTLSAYPVF